LFNSRKAHLLSVTALDEPPLGLLELRNVQALQLMRCLSELVMEAGTVSSSSAAHLHLPDLLELQPQASLSSVVVVVAVAAKTLAAVVQVELFGFRTTTCHLRRFRSLSVLAEQQDIQVQFTVRMELTAHSTTLLVSVAVEQVDTVGTTSRQMPRVTLVEAVVDTVSMETTSHLQQGPKRPMESPTTVLPSMAMTEASHAAARKVVQAVVALRPLEAAWMLTRSGLPVEQSCRMVELAAPVSPYP
jgi:hypothetical protein